MTTPVTRAWSVAIFSSREDAATLQRTLDAVVAACASRTATIDILVDNNPDTATTLLRWQPPADATATVRLWLFAWRDKACAWNRYVHDIAPAASTSGPTFFVDGYIRPRPGSFEALAHALDADPDAWAASGVPTIGPSAAQVRSRLLEDGGLHGSLYALRGAVVALLVQRDFRLPLGLYRNDSLLGAVMAFAGDPSKHGWNPRRVAIATDASWDNDQLPLLSVARWRGYLKRRLRQAQGELENAAIRQHLAIAKRAPEHLPRTVHELVAGGLDATLVRRGAVAGFLRGRAAARLARPVDWSRTTTAPRLLRTWPNP